MPAESFYGSHTMAKTFLEMLAPAVQRLKSNFYGLHQWCKGQKVVFAICTTGANRKNYYLALAPSVQIEKAAFGPLHRRYEHLQKRFGHRMTPVETLCWRYSYIELTLRGRACYVTEKMGQKGGIDLE